MMTPDQLAAKLTARLDGPHADDHTVGAARLAAEAIRYLNYATGPHAEAGLTYPATAFALAGNLYAAAYGLGQLTSQLTAFLRRELAAGRLAEDCGADPSDAVERARLHLAAADGAADVLAAALAALQSDLSGLHQSAGRQVSQS